MKCHNELCFFYDKEVPKEYLDTYEYDDGYWQVVCKACQHELYWEKGEK